VSNQGFNRAERLADQEITRRASELERLRAENAQLKRDAACFAALYEMAELNWALAAPEWVVRVSDVAEPYSVLKDIERFRKAIEARILA